VVPEKSATRNVRVVDTWWQTETGGFMITPLPGATELEKPVRQRPSSAQPAPFHNEGNPAGSGATEGSLLAITDSVGQARTFSLP